MFSSSDHVIHAGQKYTISSPSGRGMSVDYKSIFRLAISHTILEKWGKSQKTILKFGLSLTPPTNFLGEPPKF